MRGLFELAQRGIGVVQPQQVVAVEKGVTDGAVPLPATSAAGSATSALERPIEKPLTLEDITVTDTMHIQKSELSKQLLARGLAHLNLDIISKIDIKKLETEQGFFDAFCDDTDIETLKDRFLTGNKYITKMPRLTEGKILRVLSSFTPEERGRVKGLFIRESDLLEGLPDSIEKFEALEELYIVTCESLTRLPDSLGKCAKLKTLYISSGGKLEELPGSLGECANLETLVLHDCMALTVLPGSLGECANLETLDFRGPLNRLPGSIGECAKLKKLRLWDGNFTTLPDSIGNCANLEEFDIKGCSELIKLPDLTNCKRLRTLEFCRCASLELPDHTKLEGLEKYKTPELSFVTVYDRSKMRLSGTRELTSEKLTEGIIKLPTDIISRVEILSLNMCELEKVPDLSGFTNLTECDLSYCHKLTTLPDLTNCESLRTLNLGGCESLTKLPDPRGLESLVVYKTPNLDVEGANLSVPGYRRGSLTCEDIEKEIRSLPNQMKIRIRNIDITECKLLEKLPDLSAAFTNLERLSLHGCEALRELPDNIGKCTALKTFDLGGCESLNALPDNIGKCTALKTLDLEGCESLITLPDLRELENLVTYKTSKLHVEGERLSVPTSERESLTSEDIREGLSKLPNDMKSRVLDIYITGCKSLRELPDLSAFTNLERLSLHRCEALTTLPDLSAFPALITLDLLGCTALTELPESIGNLAALKHLDLRNCSSLLRLPKGIGRLQLETLDVSGCTENVKRSNKLKGQTNLRTQGHEKEGLFDRWMRKFL